jgi:dTDP-4-amino-4,6-dideoxygalactose transaminase
MMTREVRPMPLSVSHRRFTPLIRPAATLARWLSDQDARAEAVGHLESVIATRLGARHVVATASGRVALWAIMKAIDLAEGAAVWLPVNTYDGLLPGIADCGLVPRFVDVAPDHNLDPSDLDCRLARCAGPGVVVATHMFGLPCDLAAVDEVCRRRGVPFVEDCAHAFAVETGRGIAGLVGVAGLLSFQARKAVNALGGGAIVTQDDRLASRARAALRSLPGGGPHPLLLLSQYAVEDVLFGKAYPAIRVVFEDARLFGRIRGAYSSVVRFNRGGAGCLSALQAMLAAPQVADWDARRSRLDGLWASYDAVLGGHGSLDRPPSPRAGAGHGRYMYVVGTDDPERLGDILWHEGVGTTRGKAVVPCLDPGSPGSYPGAARLAARSVQVPLVDGLSDREAAHVAGSLRRAAEVLSR